MTVICLSISNYTEQPKKNLKKNYVINNTNPSVSYNSLTNPFQTQIHVNCSSAQPSEYSTSISIYFSITNTFTHAPYTLQTKDPLCLLSIHLLSINTINWSNHTITESSTPSQTEPCSDANAIVHSILCPPKIDLRLSRNEEFHRILRRLRSYRAQITQHLFATRFNRYLVCLLNIPATGGPVVDPGKR